MLYQGILTGILCFALIQLSAVPESGQRYRWIIMNQHTVLIFNTKKCENFYQVIAEKYFQSKKDPQRVRSKLERKKY